MPTPEEQEQAMIANLERSSGRGMQAWLDVIDGSGFTKHAEQVEHLKTEHALGHGYANLVVHLAKRRTTGEAGTGDLVDAQYRGKEHLRPIFDAIVAAVTSFGTDVEIAPKKAGVSLRRSKQFALVEPTTKTRVDVGLNLKGTEPGGRLEAAGGMCTHRVRITAPTEVDGELIAWLRDAWERA